jgi:hypothetical protein
MKRCSLNKCSTAASVTKTSLKSSARCFLSSTVQQLTATMRRSTVYSRTYLSSDWTPFRSKTLESLCRAKSQQKWMYSFSSPLTLTYSASTCVKNGWPFTTLPTSTTRLSVWLKKTWLLYRKSSDMLRNGLLVKLWARYLSTVTV